MDDAYFELLAYEGIDEAVDKAYRAYLDASLLKLAAETNNDREYLKRVAELRSAELYAPIHADDEANRQQTEPDEVATAAPYELGFLYWFDLRAAFWLERKKQGVSFDPLISSQSLQWIYLEVSSLQQRLLAATEIERRRQGATEPAPEVYATTEPKWDRPREASRFWRAAALDRVRASLNQHR